MEFTMNKTALTLALILAVGLIGGAITGRMSYAVPAQAQRPDRAADRVAERAADRMKGADRWEYCSLSKALVGQSRGGLYWITYFRTGGAQVVEAEELATERDGPAKAIAKLGEDGWEMVGEGPLEMRAGGINAIYFKRLKTGS
jgi:hypothetical protein